MKGLYYILDENNNVIPCDDVLVWGEWFSNFNRRQVANTKVIEGVKVSTVFIGINHSWRYGQLHIFESMIFGGISDGYTERYSTWEEAEKGHHQIVAKILLDQNL